MTGRHVTKEQELQIIEACKAAPNMRQANLLVKLSNTTFKRHAQRLGCYKPNPSNITQPIGGWPRRWLHSTDDILKGKVTKTKSDALKRRLFHLKIFDKVCNCCKLSTWLGQPMPLQLHHKDGNSTNHKLENLEILCPNCHSFTDTYCGRNKNNPKRSHRRDKN